MHVLLELHLSQVSVLKDRGMKGYKTKFGKSGKIIKLETTGLAF